MSLPGHRGHRGRAPALARTLALAAAVVLAACAAPPASPSPAGTPGASASPVGDLPIPDGDTGREQVLLRSADGRFDRYASIGQLQGASSTCTAVLLDTGGPGGGPAWALTSGHCVGITGANEVVRDAPAEGMSVAFDWFVDVPAHRVVPVTRIAWATMRSTDLALLELDASPTELRALGLRGWRPAAVPAGSAPLEVVMVGIPVGVPLVDIPAADRFLRLSTCTLDTEPVAVNERQWLWPASLRNDCPEVLPGNSGSAVIDRATGELVGVLNTTTYAGAAGAPCWLGRPCEVTPAGEIAMPDTSYAQPVADLLPCFAAGGDLALAGACPLDPGTGVTALEDAPLAVNPSAIDPLTGAPGRTSWATSVVTDGAAAYRYKIGPLASTGCADDAGYSPPVPASRIIDDPLPLTEQRLLLCVVAEGQAPRTAAMAVAYVDTSPPTAPVTFSVSGDAGSGWLVEPVFDPPELSLFQVKLGPRGEVDCDDPTGWTFYRRQAIRVGADEAPARLCAVGYDDASNRGTPRFVDLE